MLGQQKVEIDKLVAVDKGPAEAEVVGAEPVASLAEVAVEQAPG